MHSVYSQNAIPRNQKSVISFSCKLEEYKILAQFMNETRRGSIYSKEIFCFFDFVLLSFSLIHEENHFCSKWAKGRKEWRMHSKSFRMDTMFEWVLQSTCKQHLGYFLQSARIMCINGGILVMHSWNGHKNKFYVGEICLEGMIGFYSWSFFSLIVLVSILYLGWRNPECLEWVLKEVPIFGCLPFICYYCRTK